MPSDTRDNYCTMLDSGHPVDALAVKAIATQYKVSTGDDPDTRDVHAVLAWLCASNTTP
ncbi:MAG TPA: hypothetical protein VKZ89_20140 [Thermobifida alba]|nr:hypothetical protein [Thermobifida alba]